MEKEYIRKEFGKILDLIEEKRILETLEKYRKYIKKYPKDIGVSTSFSGILISLNLLEEAESVLNSVVITEDTYPETKKQFYYVKLKLLGFQGKFKECYQLFKENQTLFKEKMDSYYINIYLRKKLGLNIVNAPTTYPINQILNYNEKLAIEHIIDRHEYNSDTESKFIENFPIEQCYKYIRNEINNNMENKYASGIFRNLYIFKYFNCGTQGDKIVDYIRVITLQDTNEIITMYPVDNEQAYRYVDITPRQKEETGKKLTKRMSQIDKFNKRYGL